jgi:hypothetical protein
MKRWMTHATIAVYLGVLLLGLFSHAVMYNNYRHPLMYFIVWDMYCGWSAFESRYHALAETYDGRHYNLFPAPWGEFHPYQGPGRQHYDAQARFLPRMADAVLKHTDHDDIRRVIIVEEAWSKKFNLPDEWWHLRHAEPKDKHSYFHVRAVVSNDSEAQVRTGEWSTYLANQALMNNPRLMSDVKRGHTFFALDSALQQDVNSGVIPTGYNNAPNPGVP